METWQFGLIVGSVTTGLAGIASAVTWVGKRIIKAMDRNTEAMIKNTESNAVLSTKIDSVASFVKAAQRARTTPPKGTRIIDE